jgi:uncharacterized protein (DUF983 family)
MFFWWFDDDRRTKMTNRTNEFTHTDKVLCWSSAAAMTLLFAMLFEAPMIFGIFISVGVMCIGYSMAINKNREPAGWLILVFLTGPIGLGILMCMPTLKGEQ